MPILDFDNEFTEGVQGPVTATVVGNHVLDAGASRGRDYGSGVDPVIPFFKVIQAFNNLTSLQVDIIASDANDGTGNPVVLSTRTFLLAALLANTIFALPSLSAGTFRRFLVAKFTVTGTAPTTGTVRCGLIDKDARPQDGVVYL